MIIDNKTIDKDNPVYFIADIGANHNGDLEKAKDLIHLAAGSGANAVKFQHFQADTIVSDYGFKQIGKQGHQVQWKTSVYEAYKNASIDLEWTETLKKTCDSTGITFMTSPYSFDLVDVVDSYVSAYKIGSGDITYIDLIEYIAKKKKPIFLSTGASTMGEVNEAIYHILLHLNNYNLVLMQCNTNYTIKWKNFRHINLNVLQSYVSLYPHLILGLSDHCPGYSNVLGAVTLGAKVIEKHFTDNNKQKGPDHKFALTSNMWTEMVIRTRELENALGDGFKRVEANEKETRILQRRCLRVNKDIPKNIILKSEDIDILRPCPIDAIEPYRIKEVLGKKVLHGLKKGEYIKWYDLKEEK